MQGDSCYTIYQTTQWFYLICTVLQEKQIEETRQKMKEEKLARGEPDSDDERTQGGDKPISVILGKQYQPKRYYLGPITMKAQKLPQLIFFRGRVGDICTFLYY